MTEDQIAEYREAFSLFDLDNDGVISESELKSVMQALGNEMSDEEIAAFMRDVDTDRNGTIEFSEFLGMISKLNKAGSNGSGVHKSDLDLAFEVFDQNGDKFLSTSELRHVLVNLGEGFTDEDIDDLMKQYDKDKDGKLSYAEYRAIFTEEELQRLA